jgi:hypothetical protein
MAEDLFADIEIAPREVQELLARGENLLCVDARESWEYDTARIEGVRSMAGGIDRWANEVDPRGARY